MAQRVGAMDAADGPRVTAGLPRHVRMRACGRARTHPPTIKSIQHCALCLGGADLRTRTDRHTHTQKADEQSIKALV